MWEDLIKKAMKLLPNHKNSTHIELYDELIKKANTTFTQKEVNLIKKAYLMAKDLHRGQKRASGEPYIIHPTYVAYILLEEMNLHDISSIVAALLHDTLEDCGIPFEFLEHHFGYDVANLVLGVTKMKDLDFATKEEKEDFNNYLLLKFILEDYRVIYIKLADRLHNMRTLDYKSEAKRREKSAETLRIFAPLATHVGASLAKDELVDTSFKYLSNANYRQIKAMSKDYLIKHQEWIETTIESLKKLLADLNINAEIRPHIMSNFAIYQNLIDNKKISLLPNLIHYDIMVDNEEQIPEISEQILKNFPCLREYTRNFIAKPLNNGYKALHLSVEGKKGTPFQIRLFTKEMFLVNTYGFAALLELYPYKNIKEIQTDLIKENEFFQALSKNYKTYKKPFELINNTVRELLSDKIIVYVANGATYCLPAVSTVADLAYKIHSELKQVAIGALVNDVEVNLDFPLKNGDHVVILTKNNNLENNTSLILQKN